MKTRKAQIKDLTHVVKFAYGVVKQHQNYNSKRFASFENHEKLLEAYYTEALQSPRTIITLLEINREIMGMAFVRLEEWELLSISSEVAWLHDIFIDEKGRGKGGGKLLLNAAIEAAKSLGSTRLMLHVSPQNKLGQETFKSIGFELVMQEMMLDLTQ